MAFQYEVCQLRTTGYGANANNSGGQKACQLSFTQVFLVKITDPSDQDFNPSKVSDVHAAYAPGIPIVNYHSWYDAGANIGMPLALCQSKTVKRKDANATVFEVSCKFQTEAGKQGQSQEVQENGGQPEPEPPPTNVSDIDPIVTRSVVGRDIVLHEAPAYGYNDQPVFDNLNGGALSIQTKYLPCTGLDEDGEEIDLKNEINQPITRKQPMLQITVTQFEDTFTDANLLERCYKVNTQVFRGFPKKSAMITAINAVEQVVQMADGPALKYRVTYNILIDTYTVTFNGDSLFVGHAAAVPMIGKFFQKANDQGKTKVKQFAQKKSGLGAVGIVLIDGTPAENQMGTVPYIRYDNVAEIDFGNFLEDSVVNP